MEGINFKTTLGMTDMVISGQKTMFRIPASKKRGDKVRKHKYYVGQRLAVLQAYKDIDIDPSQPVFETNSTIQVCAKESKGWKSANLVDPELMPHVIEITDMKIENIQSISDDDCLMEGIVPVACDDIKTLDGSLPYEGYSIDGKTWLGDTPQKVFAAIADKTIKKEVWKNNAVVECYTFKIVR